MQTSSTPPQLLSCVNDRVNGHIDRYLFPDNKVKYIMITNEAYEHYRRHCGTLPAIPQGDWNYGVVVQDPITGRPDFIQAITTQFKGLTSNWHPGSYNHITLGIYSQLSTSKIHKSALTYLFGYPIVVKLARVEEELRNLDIECGIYKDLQKSEIVPDFRSYVFEDGRRIGFILEEIENARRPEAKDIGLCVDALRKLHALGISHGDAHAGKFLINENVTFLISFKMAKKMKDMSGAEQDMVRIHSSLGVNREASEKK